MGKTVPAYRMAVEWEIDSWKGFRKTLCEEGRKAFDELMEMCRQYASESSCATRPIIFEPMAMSIMLVQQKKIMRLEKELHIFLPDKADLSSNQQSNDKQVEPRNITKMDSKGDGQSRLF
jgi:hypothetical protein